MEVVQKPKKDLTAVMSAIQEAVKVVDTKKEAADKAADHFEKASKEYNDALDKANELKKEFESLFSELMPQGALGGRVRISG